MFKPLCDLLSGPVRAFLAKQYQRSALWLVAALERLCARLDAMCYYSYPQYLVAISVATLLYVISKLVESLCESFAFVRDAYGGPASWQKAYGGGA